jgi:Na+-driven multidrug efflux pump
MAVPASGLSNETLKLQCSTGTIWAISHPLILAGINDTIVEISDTIFLARYGIVELGAVALAHSIYETLLFFMFGLSDGIQIITARRAGQTQPKRIGEVFNSGLTVLLMTASIVFVILRWGTPALSAFAFRSENVGMAVNDFLGVIAFAVFLHAINYAYTGFYSGIGRTRVLIAATTVMAIFNILADYTSLEKRGSPGSESRGRRSAGLSRSSPSVCSSRST